MEERISMIVDLIDGLNRFRYVSGGDLAAYYVVPAAFSVGCRKVFLFFTDWEFRDAVFLLLDCLPWCMVIQKDSELVVSVYCDIDYERAGSDVEGVC